MDHISCRLHQKPFGRLICLFILAVPVVFPGGLIECFKDLGGVAQLQTFDLGPWRQRRSGD